jgi:hypothetical protein
VRPEIVRREVQQCRGQHQAEHGADHAQQAEVEGGGKVRRSTMAAVIGNQ